MHKTLIRTAISCWNKNKKTRTVNNNSNTGSIKLQCGRVPGEFLTPFLFRIGLIPLAANNSKHSNTGYKCG
jgi:hypothetical protein